jgi:hypothetical protein
MVTWSLGILVGVAAAVWMTPPPSLPAIPANADSPYDHRFEQLEHAVTALTQALQVNQTPPVRPEPTCVTAPANHDVSRQSLAHIIREELRQALVDASPEGQRARAEEMATAQVRNSPANRAAYQSAADVVRAALAAGRWTEEDKETFRAAFGLLLNEQRMELMQMLIPAINQGEIAVEVAGPLF